MSPAGAGRAAETAPTWPSIGRGRIPLRRILVVQTQRLGDVLCATPVFTALRRQFPAAHLTALVHRPHDLILRGNPDLDAVLTYDRQSTHRPAAARLRFLRELRAARYDWALSLHAASSVAAALHLAGIPWRTCVWRYQEYRKPHWARGFHQHVRQDRRIPGRHEIEHNLDVLRELGFDPPALAYRVEVLPDERAAACEKLLRVGRDPNRPLAVVHPGHGGGRQAWGAERYAAVADGLAAMGFQPAVTGSPAERELVAAVTGAMRGTALPLAGELSLRELAAVLAGAALFVSVSTGPMHLASALKVPAVTLYGPTDLRVERTRFSPYGSPHRAVVSPVECPCASSHTCADPACMRGISPEAVLDAARALTAETLASLR